MPDWQEAHPAVYRALAPEYRDLPEDQVEALVQGVFGENVSLADAEGLFQDLGRTLSGAAQAAAPVLQRALPGVVSGAMTGAALGPWGMLGGALLGGVGSALGGGAATAPRPPAGAPIPRPGLPPGLPAPIPGGGPPATGAGPTAAIAQLLGGLGSPTVQQALAAMLMGPAGARTVPIAGGNQVPVAAITNLLSMLASRASAEWEEAVPSVEGEGFGEGVDYAPEARSAWLYEQLLPLDDVEARDDESSRESGGEESDGGEAWLDELYDELEAGLMAENEPESVDESADPEAWRVNAYG